MYTDCTVLVKLPFVNTRFDIQYSTRATMVQSIETKYPMVK